RDPLDARRPAALQSAPRRQGPVLLAFGLTAFAGAVLLFIVEPMAAKALLPAVGGSPALWNACMALFQTLLLAGYLWAHLLTSRLKPRAAALAQTAVVLLSTLALPWAGLTVASDGGAGSPALWVVRTLAARVGLPFFVLASS